MAELKEGDKAPSFEGKDQHGNALGLSHFAGKKLALYFYPRDNTPGCTAEACSLNDGFEGLAAHNIAVLGVSPDGEAGHQRFIEKFGLKFPLLADTDKVVLKAYEAYGEKTMYGKVTLGVIRKTYIIDEQGIILKIIKKVDTKDHAGQILKALKLA